jgi:hypothetical protein
MGIEYEDLTDLTCGSRGHYLGVNDIGHRFFLEPHVTSRRGVWSVKYVHS